MSWRDRLRRFYDLSPAVQGAWILLGFVLVYLGFALLVVVMYVVDELVLR